MDTDKLLLEHTGPCIRSAEWYKEQAEEAERHWRELLLLWTRLDRNEIRRMTSKDTSKVLSEVRTLSGALNNDNKRKLKEFLNVR